MWTPTSPLTGSAITGLTSPTFTLSDDASVDNFTKSKIVTALGGTQTGVVAHTPDTPFVVSGRRPRSFKTLAPANPVTGRRASIPKNEFKVNTVKSAVVDVVTLERSNIIIETVIKIPAGAPTADPTTIKSALSAHVGLLSDTVQEISDGALTGAW